MAELRLQHMLKQEEDQNARAEALANQTSPAVDDVRTQELMQNTFKKQLQPLLRSLETLRDCMNNKATQTLYDCE